MSEWLVVVNPLAGRRGEIVDRTTRALAAFGLAAEVATPRGEPEVVDRIRREVAAGRDRFVAVGGDGTVNLVTGALMKHDWREPPTLGILPAGSGCDFVRTFGIAQRLEDAVAHLVGDDVYPADVGVLQGAWGERCFLNVAEAGVTAALVQTSMRLPRWMGFARYHVALLLAYPRFPSARIHLVADSHTYTGPALEVVFANAQFFGGGWNIAPKATVNDGLFDIQVFDVSKRDIPRIWLRARTGDHLQDQRIKRFRASRFTLETDPEWPVEADGEFFGKGPVSGRIMRAALNVKI